MKLKKKILFIILVVCIFIIFIDLLVYESYNKFTDNSLKMKNTINLFQKNANYIVKAENALVTQESISTGMYTDENYENFSVIIEIPSQDYSTKEAWLDGEASIAFESRLQRTTEWLVNNKYKISIYYYSGIEKQNKKILFEKDWVGNNHIISCIQSLPKEALDKSIYVEYASDLGKFLFFTNGNDIRFLDNYLTIY